MTGETENMQAEEGASAEALPDEAISEATPEKRKKTRAWFAARFGKNAFWLWVGYQAIKGTLTTTFIWAPIIYAWLHHQ